MISRVGRLSHESCLPLRFIPYKTGLLGHESSLRTIRDTFASYGSPQEIIPITRSVSNKVYLFQGGATKKNYFPLRSAFVTEPL